MKIISVNIDKGCTDPYKRNAFQNWINAERPDLVLSQECCRYGEKHGPKYYPCRPLDEHSPLGTNGGDDTTSEDNSRVACYGRTGTRYADFVVEKRSDRWQIFRADGMSIHNVYFPAKSTRLDVQARLMFLRKLTIETEGRNEPNMVIGDFNLAPTRDDYESNGKSTNYYSEEGKQAFDDLCRRAHLYDATFPATRPVFTIVRKNSRFRCDLALASDCLKTVLLARYEHRTRVYTDGPNRADAKAICPFTDHSGIVIDVHT